MFCFLNNSNLNFTRDYIWGLFRLISACIVQMFCYLQGKTVVVLHGETFEAKHMYFSANNAK